MGPIKFHRGLRGSLRCALGFLMERTGPEASSGVKPVCAFPTRIPWKTLGRRTLAQGFMEDVDSSKEKKDLLLSSVRSTSSMIPCAKPHLPNVFQGILMRKRIYLFGLRRELPTASSGYGDPGVGIPVQP